MVSIDLYFSALFFYTWTLCSSSSVVDCGVLVDPDNGTVTLEDTVFESEAMYTCDEFHNLVGTAVRMCNASGLWSDSAPTCESKS